MSATTPDLCSPAWLEILAYFANLKSQAQRLMDFTDSLKDQIEQATAGDPTLITPAFLNTVYLGQESIEAVLTTLAGQQEAYGAQIVAAAKAKYGWTPPSGL
jgi:hypothetical protein